MTDVVSIAEVQAAGVTIDAAEAVAIAQQLIAAMRNPDAVSLLEPPFGPPTTRNVQLSVDGRVICRACQTTPAVSETAIFLQSLLSSRVHVPGGLRYTLARALLDVDVPPFDSLDDFSETLARYERGARDQAVRRVLGRLDGRRAVVPAVVAERRRSSSPTELRRALREADQRLYLQRLACESLIVVPPAQPAPRSMHTAAGFIAAGLLLIAAGELADRILPAPLATATVEPRTENREPRTEKRELRTGNREPRTANAERRAPSPELRTPAVTRASRIQHPQAPRSRATKLSSSHGVFDRLRLGWLKHAFTRP